MLVTILTFEGFNEIDAFVVLNILGRVRRPGWRVLLAGPQSQVRSMNGVVVDVPGTFSDAVAADAVVVGSGSRTRDVVADAATMAALALDPSRQLVGAQCSGALILARLGLLGESPVCTDLTTRPWVEAAGARVLDQAFVAHGNIASAGGCLASPYLAAWIITRLAGADAAAEALHHVAPVGEKDVFVAHAMARITPYLG